MRTHRELKERHRRERENQGEFVRVRMHRALSWLDRAGNCPGDEASQVIFLWIAFNAAYANEIDLQYRPDEKALIHLFLDRMCGMDRRNRMNGLVWKEFAGPIRVLLDNKFVFQPFWDHLTGRISAEEWQDRFARANAAARKAIGAMDTPKTLAVILSRVYTLRNQLVHGGATWNSAVNRDQVRDCARFLAGFVPAVIEIMMDNHDALWGQPCYPVV